MKITTRLTRNFVEIEVDETETTIHEGSQKELKDTIENLVDVAIELATYTDKSIIDFIDEPGDH